MLHLLGGADQDLAVIDADLDREWTYRQIRQAVSSLAARLPQAGVALLAAPTATDTIINLFAAWAAGLTVVLHDPGLPPESLTRLCAAYEPDALLGGEYPASPLTGGAPPPAEGLALVLMTSGSTGSPKGVRLSAAAMTANARAIGEALRLDVGHRAVLNLPLHYTYGLSVLLSHLACGATVVVTTASILQPGFRTAVDASRATSVAGVPYTYALMQRVGFLNPPPPSLRHLTQAGGRLDPGTALRLAREVAPHDVALWTMYGQTEACARMTVLPPEHLEGRAGSVGWPVPGGALRVEVDGLPQPADVVGDVVFEGPSVMWGYATDRRDLGRGDDLRGVLHTGDVGRLDPDGCLWLEGRSSRFAKIAGIRVSLGDLEEMLAPMHGELAAIAEDERVRLVVTAGDAADHKDLVRGIARRLGLHHSSFAVTRVDALPRTSAGKVDHGRLKDVRHAP